MGSLAPGIRLLVLDGDPVLTADARAFTHPDVIITMASDGSAASGKLIEHRFDAVAIELSAPGGWELLARLGEQSDAPALIALATQARPGETLEYTLTIAELRGAQASSAKPIDAAELVAIAACLVACRRPSPGLSALAVELEARIATYS